MGKKAHFTQERLEECVDENDGFVKCPECDEEFDTSQGVSLHYGYNHEGSISNLFRCEECGRLKFGIGQKNTFCSKWCETYSRVGTFKHLDKEYLENKIVNEGLRSVDIAEELGLKKSLVHKWVRKYEIGNEYPCPSCEKSFATKQGVSKHHKDKHGESISGSTYTCDYCGEISWTRKSKDDSSYPRYCDDDCFGASMTGEDNPNKSKERREKISQTMRENYREGDTQHSERDREWMMENVVDKRDDSYLHQTPSEKTREKLSKAQKEIVERGEHHLQDPEVRERIVKTRDENGTWDWYADVSPEEAQELSVEARDVFGPKIIDVEETGNTVDSTWEAEVDRLLSSLELSYYYNDGDKTRKFNLEDGNYVPDFIIPGITKDIVIEVKGWLGYGYNKEKSESYAKQMSERDDVEYIVYGDVELECDRFIEYGEEGELESVLD